MIFWFTVKRYNWCVDTIESHGSWTCGIGHDVLLMRNWPTNYKHVWGYHWTIRTIKLVYIPNEITTNNADCNDQFKRNGRYWLLWNDEWQSTSISKGMCISQLIKNHLNFHLINYHMHWNFYQVVNMVYKTFNVLRSVYS